MQILCRRQAAGRAFATGDAPGRATPEYNGICRVTSRDSWVVATKNPQVLVHFFALLAFVFSRGLLETQG